MSDIFTEVDETLRQEKMQSLWKRWRPFVFAGIALIVGGVAANEFAVRPYMESQRAQRALALEEAVKALQDGRYAEAEAGLSAIVQNDPKMAALAANLLAQTQYEGGGDAEGAAETLASVGGTEAGPYERIALLKAAYFRADALSLAELETSLGTLVDDNSALGALARELVAAKAFEAGDFARARTEFNRLRFDPAAPQGVIRRADVALAAIPVVTATETETTPAPEEEAPAEPQETGQ